MARRSKFKNKNRNIFITVITILVFLCVAYQNEIKSFMTEPLVEPAPTYKIENIPQYSAEAYVTINVYPQTITTAII